MGASLLAANDFFSCSSSYSAEAVADGGKLANGAETAAFGYQFQERVYARTGR